MEENLAKVAIQYLQGGPRAMINNRKSSVDKIAYILEGDTDVRLAYLFGSQATRLTHPRSDIDIAVYLKDGNRRLCLQKEEELAKELVISLGTDKIDLVILNVAGVELEHKVITTGTLLFSRDEAERIEYEEGVLLRYLDIKPYLDEYDSLLFERIKAGPRK
jgi:predicted nucleotidyltransferase